MDITQVFLLKRRDLLLVSQLHNHSKVRSLSNAKAIVQVSQEELQTSQSKNDSTFGVLLLSDAAYTPLTAILQHNI